MGALTNLEIGSIVCNLVENIPSTISGTLVNIVNNQVYFAEIITGNDISVSSIEEKYQPGIISLTISSIMGLMGAQGIGTKSVKIGELSIMKGMNESSAKEWRDIGLEQLKSIGERISSYQCWG